MLPMDDRPRPFPRVVRPDFQPKVTTVEPVEASISRIRTGLWSVASGWRCLTTRTVLALRPMSTISSRIECDTRHIRPRSVEIARFFSLSVTIRSNVCSPPTFRRCPQGNAWPISGTRASLCKCNNMSLQVQLHGRYEHLFVNEYIEHPFDPNNRIYVRSTRPTQSKQ